MAANKLTSTRFMMDPGALGDRQMSHSHPPTPANNVKPVMGLRMRATLERTNSIATGHSRHAPRASPLYKFGQEPPPALIATAVIWQRMPSVGLITLCGDHSRAVVHKWQLSVTHRMLSINRTSDLDQLVSSQP